MMAVETKPAFEGYIANTQDALIVFEGQSLQLSGSCLLFALTTTFLPASLPADPFRIYHAGFRDHAACRRGIVPRARNRLSDAERKAIVSGCVFVFSEEESKIKRWAISSLPIISDNKFPNTS